MDLQREKLHTVVLLGMNTVGKYGGKDTPGNMAVNTIPRRKDNSGHEMNKGEIDG